MQVLQFINKPIVSRTVKIQNSQRLARRESSLRPWDNPLRREERSIYNLISNQIVSHLAAKSANTKLRNGQL